MTDAICRRLHTTLHLPSHTTLPPLEATNLHSVLAVAISSTLPRTLADRIFFPLLSTLVDTFTLPSDTWAVVTNLTNEGDCDGA